LNKGKKRGVKRVGSEIRKKSKRKKKLEAQGDGRRSSVSGAQKLVRGKFAAAATGSWRGKRNVIRIAES